MRTRARVTLALFLGAAVVAAGGEPELEVLPPGGQPTVGQRLVVRVVARGGQGSLWGDLKVAVEPDGSWELLDGPHAVPGADPPAWDLTLAAMKLGELQLPSLSSSLRSASGETRQVAAAPPALTVASVLPDDDQGQPAPLRDPVGARGFPWEWVVPGLAAGLPVAAVLALWLARRRRREQQEAARTAMPPLAELEALAASLLAGIGRDPADSVCDRLAAGLRRFLERRTGEPALEMTSFELRLLGRRRGWPEGVQRAVQAVMGVADSVRFGRRDLTEAALHEAVTTAVDVGRGLEAHLAPAPEARHEMAG